MGRILLILFTLGLGISGRAFALANVDNLLVEPQAIIFEKLFCAANQLKNPEKHLEITRVCWLRSPQNFSDLDYLEALLITFDNGDFMIYHLSEFIFDTQLSRASGSQILKATLRGEQLTGAYALSRVYKEYLNTSRLTREDQPLRIFGSLPTGHNFLIQRELP